MHVGNDKFGVVFFLNISNQEFSGKETGKLVSAD